MSKRRKRNISKRSDFLPTETRHISRSTHCYSFLLQPKPPTVPLENVLPAQTSFEEKPIELGGPKTTKARKSRYYRTFWYLKFTRNNDRVYIRKRIG